MLQLHVSTLVEMHGAEHQQTFLIKYGLSPREARTVSYPQKMRMMRYGLLQRVCEGLLCTPNDVFRWSGKKDSHLKVLNRTGKKSLSERLGALKDPKEYDRLMEELLDALEAEPKVKRMHDGRLFLNVGRLLRMRGVKKLHRELKRMGFTHNEAANLLSGRQKAFKLSLLTRVCVAFNCLPNDVLDFEGPEGHVLQALKKEPVVSLEGRLAGLTEEQLIPLSRM